jgi:hypothetical protein
MKKPVTITLFVVLAVVVVLLIAFIFNRHSVLSGRWAGTHQITASTDGPQSFNSKKCGTFCELTESNGQITGSITMFGVDESAFRNTEELHGTLQGHAIAWTSGRAWEDGNKKPHQYTASFQGTRDGDTITGRFDQTWNEDGKTVTYSGTVELKKQSNATPEPARPAP